MRKFSKVLVLTAIALCAFATLPVFSADGDQIFSRAKKAFDAQKYEVAEKLFEKGFEVNGGNALAYYYYGLSLKAQKRETNQIIAALNKAIELDGNGQIAADAMAEVTELEIEKRDSEEFADAPNKMMTQVLDQCFCYNHRLVNDENGVHGFHSVCVTPLAFTQNGEKAELQINVGIELSFAGQKEESISFNYLDTDASVYNYSSKPPRVSFLVMNPSDVTSVAQSSWALSNGVKLKGLAALRRYWDNGGELYGRLEIEGGKLRFKTWRETITDNSYQIDWPSSAHTEGNAECNRTKR